MNLFCNTKLMELGFIKFKPFLSSERFYIMYYGTSDITWGKPELMN